MHQTPELDLETQRLVAFTFAWRDVWRTFRQQRGTLRVLYESALKAATVQLVHPNVGEDVLSTAALAIYRQYLETLEHSHGARDAYSTAIVLFIDDCLKAAHHAFCKLNLSEELAVGINGIPLWRLFMAGGNNVRHYASWAAPRPHPKAFENAQDIAQACGDPPFEAQYLSTYAYNIAWRVVEAAAQGSYENLLLVFESALREMLDKSGTAGSHWITYELSQDWPIISI